MRFKTRFYQSIIIGIILLLNSGIVFGQSIPDTIRVECKEMVLPNSEFTLEVSMFTDSALAGISIPLTFYNPNNLDIYIDSITWSSWITDNPPDIEGREWHNGAGGDTAKTLKMAAVWLADSLVPGQGAVATIHFHTGPTWDSNLYTKIDSTTYYPPSIGVHLELTNPDAFTYIPEFIAGCLGPPPTPHKPQLQLPDTQEVNAGDTVEFVVVATDEDPSDILTITKYGVGDFITTPGPSPDTGFFSWATTDNDTVNSPYTDTFIVDDGTGLSDTGFVVIIVNPFYHNPTLTFVPSPPYTLLGGDTLEFTVIAQDPDPEQILTITKYGVGDFTTTPSVAPCSGFFFWATTLDDTGTHFDTFIVDDGTGLADTEIVSIEVFPYVPPAAYGDLNHDGKIDFADVVFLANYLFKDGPPPTPLAAGDINSDCYVTIGDIVYLSNFLVGTGPEPKPWCLPGDVNHDGYVNVPDVIYFINYLLKSGEEPESKKSTDVNADCKIDVVDLVYLINFLFRGGPIPEPGCVESLSLLFAKAKPETAELTLTDFVPDRTSEIIEIPISAKFDVPIAGVQLEIGFDPQKLEALDPVLSSRSEALTLYHNTKQDYQLIGIFDINLKNLIQPGDGTIITLRFKPKSESFDLSKIKIREAILVDPSAYELQVTINQETGSLVK